MKMHNFNENQLKITIFTLFVYYNKNIIFDWVSILVTFLTSNLLNKFNCFLFILYIF